jgi:hypothetical protein
MKVPIVVRVGVAVSAAVVVAVLLGAVLLRSFSDRSPLSGSIGLGVVNATSLQVSLVVNGTVIKSFAPGGADKAIYVSALPSLPWAVEARTSSGRVLATMNVTAGDLQPESGITAHGTESGIGLSCGQLYMWSGPTEPSWPAPQPGSPGDCLP